VRYFVSQKISWPFIQKTILNVFVADTITVFFYILVHYFDLKIPISLGFFITIILLLSVYKAPKGSISEISLSQAAIIGTVQGISLLPGISRLASTFTAARWLGIQPMPAFIFSWLIQLPLIVLAFGDSVLHITKSNSWQYLLNLPMALVIVISCVIAWYALMIMVRLVKHDRVAIFGWYMIVPFLISLLI
jgi:undecaprenyl-diphosphatase